MRAILLIAIEKSSAGSEFFTDFMRTSWIPGCSAIAMWVVVFLIGAAQSSEIPVSPG
jgi:hypothetical protein